MGRPLERQRLGVQKILDDVGVGPERGIESRARRRRVPFLAKSAGRPRIRPQRLNVVLELLQQGFGLRVAIQLQQRDHEQVTNTVIVVGIEP